MGRYYSGNICGKFWFGVQSSGAMEKYGATEEGPEFRFKSCRCCCECFAGDFVPQEKDYCEDCFNSYEDHIKEVREENDDNDTECFEEDESGRNFTYDRDKFEDQGLPFIQEHEELFNKYIESLTFEDADEEYAYEEKWVVDICGSERPDAFEREEDGGLRPNREDEKILADLCMLKQIQHFFEKEETKLCSWYAEY